MPTQRYPLIDPGWQRISLVTEKKLTRVLVIDEDTAMTEMVRHVLEPDCFQIIEATSDTDGVAAVRDHDPDIVVLDLLLPGNGGWEVCKKIRAFSDVPILVLSAVSKPEMVARALDEGADDYLLKPMPSSVLIAHIKKLARRAQAEQNHDGSLTSSLQL